jgi:hypothetical protein
MQRSAALVVVGQSRIGRANCGRLAGEIVGKANGIRESGNGQTG